MIKEMLCQTAVDYECQPDGGRTPVLDAYDGCQLGCPYCFQWQDLAWNRDILVKTNFPEVLEHELETWDPTQTLYVGSRGDPYMALESKYRLTRRTLQVLQAHAIPCILSTKSNASALFEDIDLFLKYGDKLVICMRQANLAHLRQTSDPRELPNIRTANELARLGIETWVFITPVLPGITDVKAMIQALPEEMPVYLDILRLEPGSVSERRFFEYLRTCYPELEGRYRAMLREGSDPYYMELKELYQAEPRVKFVFGEPG
jgi:DNA repair photolyase